MVRLRIVTTEAMCMAVGKESLELWPMLQSSFGSMHHIIDEVYMMMLYM